MSTVWIYLAIAGCIAAIEIFSRNSKPTKPNTQYSSTDTNAQKEEFGKRMLEQKKLHDQINKAKSKQDKILTSPHLEEEEKKQIEMKQKTNIQTVKSDDESSDQKELTKEEKEKLEKEEEEAMDREEEEKEREKLLANLASHKRRMKYILYILLLIDIVINGIMIIPKHVIDDGLSISIFSVLNVTRLFHFTSDIYDLVFATFIRIEILLWFIDLTIEFGDIKNYDQERDDHKYFDIKRINKIHQGLAWIVTQFIDAHSIENGDESDSNEMAKKGIDNKSCLLDSEKKDDDESSKLKIKKTFDAEDIVKKYDNTAAEDVADFWKATLWIATFLILTVFQAYLGVKIVFFVYPVEYQNYYQTFFAVCIGIGHLEVYFAKKYIDDACRPHNQYFNSDIHQHPLYKKKAKGNWCQLCWEKQKTGDIYNCRECHRHFCRKCWKKKKKAKQTGENQLRSDSAGVELKDSEVTLIEYFTRVGTFYLPQKKWMSVALISMLISSIIGVFAPKQTGKLLDKIIEGDLNGFYVMVIQSVFFTVIIGLVDTLQTRSMQRVKEQIQCDVQQKLFGALLSQDMAFYDGSTPNNLYQRMDWGLREMLQPFEGLVKTLLVSFVSLFGSMIMCWNISWKLTLLGMSTIGPMSYISMLFSSWSRSQMSVQWKLRSELWNIVWGSFDNIKTVRAFAREPLLTSYYSALRKEQLDKKLKSQYMSSINQTINSWLGLAAKILVTWSGGLLILRQQQNADNTSQLEQIVTVGAFITFREYWKKLSGTIQDIRRRISSFDQARFMAKQIFRTLDNQPSIERAANVKYKNKYRDADTNVELDGKMELKDIEGDITFQDVHFHYQMSPKKKVLKGVDLTIPHGKVTALVGRSGGGKSTMMHLLLRFYDPKAGKICINGVDIRKYNPYSLRRLVSLVAQDNEMFSQSIEFNVAYGVNRYNDKGIEEAATLANAHEFILKFDDGYDSRMGSRGTRVSGGQKQRINIARMLMAKPKLMLLDEATSALDAESEALVQAALDHAIEEYKCTVVLVAHRLSTVVNADKICVVDDGQIVETGTHDELIEKNGIYARLVHRQVNLQSKMKEKVADAKSGKKATDADYDNIDKLIDQIKKEKEEEKKKAQLVNDNGDNKIEEEPEQEETWDRYDDLKLSDDEKMSDALCNSASLLVPENKLKSMGSVVDLLLNGPYSEDDTKMDSNKIAQVISVTAPQNVMDKKYNISVSDSNDKNKIEPMGDTDEIKNELSKSDTDTTSIFEIDYTEQDIQDNVKDIDVKQ